MGELNPFKIELKKDPIFREEKEVIELPTLSFSEESDNQNNRDGENGEKVISLLNKDTEGKITAIKYDYPKEGVEYKLLKVRGVGINDAKYEGQGLGIQLYKKLISLAQEKGLDGISSDSVVQGGALVVWKKLKEAGYDINVNPGALEKWNSFLKTYEEGKMFKELISVEKTNAVFKILTAKEVEPTYNLEQKMIVEEDMLFELNKKGIEDIATKELLAKYAAQCEQRWEAKITGDSNMAHLECAFELAVLYGKTEKYKEYAVESMEELLMGIDVGSEMEERILATLKTIEF